MDQLTLNGQPLPDPDGGRVRLTGLAAENELIAGGGLTDVGGMDPGLIRFTDPADGAGYLIADGYPDQAARVFCCFDQPSLPGTLTLAVRAPAGWQCLGNSPADRDGDGVWRFGAVIAMRPHLFTVCAGPYRQADPAGSGPDCGDGIVVRTWRRASLAGQDAALQRFARTAAGAIEHYARVLGTPCRYRQVDIVFVPELTALAGTMPGLITVSESLLALMADPEDEFAAQVSAHEAAHLWFGTQVTMRWWDDLWLEEALATYLSVDFLDGWAGFAYREKACAYRADQLPGRRPVCSPVADSAQALSRPAALTYAKGAALIRQLGALIGKDALRAGMHDYLGKFAGSCGTYADLMACWSQASGRDLAGWAQTWLRSEGAPVVRAELADGSVLVTQDPPRPQVIGIALYDRAPQGLERRRLIRVELAGARTAIALGPGEASADALVANDGDLAYARIAFDERSWQALTDAALQVNDPVTEAACWNAAWQLVTSAQLPAEAFADLVLRRLTGPAGLPAAGAEVLLDRAVSCADVHAPPSGRARLREQIAQATLDAARQAAPGNQAQRTLATAFAASAHRSDQLDLLTSWLDGRQLPDGLTMDTELRTRILYTLSARGQARQADVDALPELDPANGTYTQARCLALRPDPEAKKQAWTSVISGAVTGRLAEATALGLWTHGQEQLMASYRHRYFAEALPALTEMGNWAQQRLGRLLFPSTLRDDATITAAEAVLANATLTEDLRNAIAEQTAILREATASPETSASSPPQP